MFQLVEAHALRLGYDNAIQPGILLQDSGSWIMIKWKINCSILC